MTSPRRRFPCLTLVTSILGLIVCLLVLASAWLAVQIPSRAEEAFGPPSLDLDPLDHILFSARLLLNANDLTLPANIYGGGMAFEVSAGESPAQVALRLEEMGLISNASAFIDYLVYAGLDTTLQAGEYFLSPQMTPLEIAQALQDATPSEVTFNILAGWRREEVAEALPSSGLAISPQVFLAVTNQIPLGYDFLAGLPEEANLEGFLMPGSYLFPRDTDVSSFVDTILIRFQSAVTPDLRQRFEFQGLSLYEAVTLASIVERESIVEDEMPLIASVFLNRLEAGMKLESDPTVQFALGFNEDQFTWWTNPLSLIDLQFDSPYNTYRYAGLPPGPIANPGLNALRAVAYPAQTPYFYFRAACDATGKHNFSETFEEHLQNGCE